MKGEFKVIQRTRLANGKRKQITYYIENVNLKHFDRTFKTYDTGEISAYKKGKNYFYNDRTIGISSKYIPIERKKK